MHEESALDRAMDANDKLLKSFRFKTYLMRMRSVARMSHLGGSTADWPTLLKDMEAIVRLFDCLPEDVETYAVRVASEHLRLARATFSLRGCAYIQYCKEADLRLQIDEDFPHAMSTNPFRRATAKDHKRPAQLASTMSGLLDAYKRRLAYMAGLVGLTRGEDSMVKRLVNKGTHALERMLLIEGPSLWPGIVLGGEYPYLQRAMVSRNVMYSPDKKTFHLRSDRSPGVKEWKGEYSSAEMMSMMFHVAAWGCGWILGRLMERAELGAYIEGSSKT